MSSLYILTAHAMFSEGRGGGGVCLPILDAVKNLM